MMRNNLLIFALLTIGALLPGCGGDGDRQGDTKDAINPSTNGTGAGTTGPAAQLNPATLTTVRPIDDIATRQREVARLTELADAAEQQGQYAQAVAFLQAAMPLAISLEPTLRGTIEIAEDGHRPQTVKDAMLSDSARLLVARQILRQANPFDASEQVTPEELAQAFAAGLTVLPQSTTGRPPYTVIIECDAQKLNWDPARNWEISRQAIDRSVHQFIRLTLANREKVLLADRERLEKQQVKDKIAVNDAEDKAAQFAKQHPGVAIENINDAQKELATFTKIAEDALKKQSESLTVAMQRQDELQTTIDDAPDVIQKRESSQREMELKKDIVNIKALLNQFRIGLRRPDDHPAVKDALRRLEQANASLASLSDEQRYVTTQIPNKKKQEAKLNIDDAKAKTRQLKEQNSQMRDVLIRYRTVAKDFEGYRTRYAALAGEVAKAKERFIVTEASLREANDQLRSPTASQIRYVTAPPKFPSWTRMKNRLSSLQQQAGQFGQYPAIPSAPVN